MIRISASYNDFGRCYQNNEATNFNGTKHLGAYLCNAGRGIDDSVPIQHHEARHWYASTKRCDEECLIYVNGHLAAHPVEAQLFGPLGAVASPLRVKEIKLHGLAQVRIEDIMIVLLDRYSESLGIVCDNKTRIVLTMSVKAAFAGHGRQNGRGNCFLVNPLAVVFG